MIFLKRKKIRWELKRVPWYMTKGYWDWEPIGKGTMIETSSTGSREVDCIYFKRKVQA